MIRVKREGIILRPTRRIFENKSVYNPGIYQDDDQVHVMYRAQNKEMMSCFGYACLNGPLKVVKRWKRPLYTPQYSYESKGIEDPRITKLGDTFYVTYVAHDGLHALIAYMYGKSIFKLRRGGIISPTMMYRDAVKLFETQKLKDDYFFFASYYEKFAHKNVKVWEKDGLLFPERINGQYAMLHHINPDMQLVKFKDFSQLKKPAFWEKHLKNISRHVALEGRYGWEARHIGGGAPPLKTKKGWLLIYHGVEPRNKGRIYYAGAALQDLKNPTRTIARLPYPLFVPRRKNERHGLVHNVVFPTGTAVFGKHLYIYYGSADSYVSAASVNLDDLLKELMHFKVKPGNPVRSSYKHHLA